MAELKKKPLFNPEGDIDVRLRRMIGGNTTNLNDFNNMKYPWVSDWYRQAMNNFWIPEEINLSQDVKDYEDQPGHKGNGKWTNDQLYSVLYEARRAGFQTWCHAIGDAANRQCLDVYEQLLKELPDKDARLRSEHAQIIAPEDIERFRKLGVIPTHQTVFLRTYKNVADARLGAERIKGAYAWRTLIDQGNPLPNGTDSPVESCNPFLSMYCAVTRKDEHLKPEGGWHPQEAMTREEALRSYTNWAAYAAFEEQLKGSIEPGKLADFVVIDRDYMKCPEEEIKDICSLQTVVGGEVVYETK